MRVTLTVFFEDPFYVGVVERVDEQNRLTVARQVFGAAPSDQQLFEWLLRRYASLRFSPPVEAAPRAPIAENPKRRARQAARSLAREGVGTRSQQAIQAGREACRLERRERSREERDAELQRRFDLRQEKKKAKHRGH